MDLKQRKLNKSEWTSIEVMVSEQEIDILNLIMKGYYDVNIKINNTNSIFTYLKIEYSEKMEDYLYIKYLKERVDKVEDILKISNKDYKKIKTSNEAKINSADKIRLERFDLNLMDKTNIYEFILLKHMEELVGGLNNDYMFNFHYYTLMKLSKNNILRLNRHIQYVTSNILTTFENMVKSEVIIENAVNIIEKNSSLLKYSDLTLYQHQKEIFTVCKKPNPKLILYVAPTGTGKTMTPIALSCQKKVIFVCAARHVGLALAKSAISVKKKIAFAFGCASSDDIRLHYFAAKEYSINKRTGGIGKVDNTVGDAVEIMICDIKSYLPAMYYMLSFNDPENLILYWDEPTIAMDCMEHEFHKTIRKNWKKNIIPNIVLSSATLPKLNELTETIPDFLNKFKGAEICNIVSHDCKKSIPIINKDGFVALPHYLSNNYSEIQNIGKHCENYLTILRYFDLKEVVNFITYCIQKGLIKNKMRLDRHFETLDDITMTNIKIYYIKLLLNIQPDLWSPIYDYFKEKRVPRIFENDKIDNKGNKIMKVRSVGPGISAVNSSSSSSNLKGAPLTRLTSEQPQMKSSSLITTSAGTSGVYLTTKDAYTLTDGPTIFMSNDIEKIAKFFIQQANIPASVLDDIMKKIDYNNAINERLFNKESELEYIREKKETAKDNSSSSSRLANRNKSSKDSRKVCKAVVDDDSEMKGEIGKLTNEINTLRSLIKYTYLNDTFIPNTKLHLDKWASGLNVDKAFTSNVDENVVCDIMALNGVDNTWKVLLMMGIGVFINHENIAYTEIMKKLADEQKLYMIIATSDYIYGTNYQFCHGFVGKDLNLTQEKLIQAMGRIGRNNIQQNYTMRIRDDNLINKLFNYEENKPEVINMNLLFNSKKMAWNNGEYVETNEKDDEETNDYENLNEITTEESDEDEA